MHVISAGLAHRRGILRWALAVAALVGIVTLLRARTYSAHSAFVPASRGTDLSQLAGFAAQLGVNVGSEARATPEFFAELLVSDAVMRPAVRGPYRWQGDEGDATGSLVEFYELSGLDSARAEARAIELLRDAVALSIGKLSGIVSYRVKTRDRVVSYDATRALLVALDSVNVQARQAQARRERQFVEQRLTELRQELDASERRLEQFLAGNRDFRGSPQLTVQYDRLQRDVTLRQQVVLTLAQGFEQARMEEVRNTPLLSVIEPPVLPARPDRRGLIIKTIAAGIFGLLSGWLVAMLLMLARLRAVDHSERHKLGEQWGALRADLRRPWRLF